MPQPDPDRLVFSDVVIDFAGRRLLRGGAEQALEPKAFAVLALLASSPGRVFGRDEILEAVWGHWHVTQSVLNRVMSLLRQALEEDAQQPRLLHTDGIGYRFDVPATEGVAAPSVPAGRPRPVRGSRRGRTGATGRRCRRVEVARTRRARLAARCPRGPGATVAGGAAVRRPLAGP